jgi:sortase A
VARLAIPAQGIDLLVLAGANGRTLAWGPGHHDGSAAPGASGLAVITAHRDTHFRFLGDLRVGDRIEVESTAGSRQRYRVVTTRIADHRELLLPEAPAVPMLALVTCWPLEGIDPGTPWRYAVLATGEE